MLDFPWGCMTVAMKGHMEADFASLARSHNTYSMTSATKKKIRINQGTHNTIFLYTCGTLFGTIHGHDGRVISRSSG